MAEKAIILNAIIEKIGQMIISSIGESRIRSTLEIPKTEGREGQDIFDELSAQIGINRLAAIRVCAEQFPSQSKDGKWRDIAKWVIDYEREQDARKFPRVTM